MRSTANDFASSACIIKIIKKHLVKKVCERSFIKIPEDSNDIGLISDLSCEGGKVTASYNGWVGLAGLQETRWALR